MSQIMDSLNKLEKAQSEKSTKKVEKKAKPWLGKAFVGVGFILILGINMITFLATNKLSKRIDSVILAVVKSQNSVSDNTEQMASLSEGLGEIGAGIKDLKGEVSGLGIKVSWLGSLNNDISKLSGKIFKLEKYKDITHFSLRTLTKAKDTLFKKVGDLRVNIQELKNSSEVK